MPGANEPSPKPVVAREASVMWRCPHGGKPNGGKSKPDVAP